MSGNSLSSLDVPSASIRKIRDDLNPVCRYVSGISRYLSENGHTMSPADNLVVFTLDSQTYALALSSVERAVRMVEITPLPQAPEIVLGVINIEGLIIPVLDIRRRFRLPARRPGLGDQLLIARTAHRPVALVVDAVRDVIESAGEEETAPAAIIPGIEYVTGVVKLPDGLLFIHDLDEFLSIEEEKALEVVISGTAGQDGTR